MKSEVVPVEPTPAVSAEKAKVEIVTVGAVVSVVAALIVLK